MPSLYVHIPFCAQKCAYCDFCSYAGLDELIPAYAKALVAEVRLRTPRWRAYPIDTLYIGGGTPTLLPIDLVAAVLDACRQHLDLGRLREATIEANPGTLSLSLLRGLRQAGLDRISIGVQSFRDGELALLGRIHTADQAMAAVQMAREAGFARISLDLLMGLPRQSLADWQESLERALTLGPEHLSLYGLTLEEGTPLRMAVDEGRLPRPDDGLAADMYLWAERRLARAGYAHYEISNWARRERQPGGRWSARSNRCQHNLRYWRNGRYLGLGAGAVSYDGRTRCQNTGDVRSYMRRVEQGDIPTVESEALDAAGRMGETMMLALRTSQGMRWGRFERRFGRPMAAVYGDVIASLCADGLLAADERGIRLTRRGRLLGNRVFAAFLA